MAGVLEYTDDIQSRPAKRLKMEDPKVELIPFQTDDDFDDDDFYTSPAKKEPVPQKPSSQTTTPTFTLPSVSHFTTLSPTIPGLNTEAVSSSEVPVTSTGSPVKEEAGESNGVVQTAHLEEKVSNVKNETIPDAMEIEQSENGQKPPVDLEAVLQTLNAAANPPVVKPELDPEFLQAAEVNKDDKNAEWRYDPSDAESSESSDSSDSSDDSSDEDDSDGDDVLLDPAEQVRILMKAMDEDGPSTAGPLRTAKEKPDEFLPKPTLEITPEMKITELGVVESVIDNYVLITAKTSGEYMVLESGSVLCLQDRTVLGAVHETIGQVQSPIYMIGYNSVDEVKETGVTKGTKVFYVDDHSTYVFTKAIQAFKGTDASNIHDEEVADEEMEFSDDEQEADYKRRRKEAKKSRWEAKNGVAPSNHSLPQRPTGIAANSSQQTAYPTTIKYDDDDDEDMYKPLARPDNLHEMMAFGAPEERLPRSVTNGRGRGRGDRQWVDRGRGGRGRGGRGRGSSNSAGDGSQRPGQSDNARRGRGGHRGQDQRSPLPARPEQSAPAFQTPAFPFVPPLINGVPPPPPIAMPFQFGQQGMPMLPIPPPIPGPGFSPNNFQNGAVPSQVPPNLLQAFANFQQQFAQLSQQSNRQATQSPQVQPSPQWSQASIPPPMAAPNPWAGVQAQQQTPNQASPPNAQLESLLRMINAKPKE